MPAFHDLDPAADASVAGILSELDLRPEYDNGPLGEGAAEDSTTSALGGARSEYSTKSAEDTSVNASAPATITMFTSDDKTLSKSYVLGADGRLVKDGSASLLRSGRARLVSVPTAASLAAVITACARNQAFLYSRFSDPNLQETGIGTTGRVEVDHISRTEKNFTFADGPGWCPVDIDEFDGDPLAALRTVMPELASCAYVLRASTSAGIYDDDTLAPLTPSNKWHLSILLKSQRDLPRFLEDLHKRLWLGGHGWIKLSAAGTMLVRSPVDLAMRGLVQPIFEGAPELGPGLAQTPRLALANKGGPLDTVSGCKPLTAAERAEYKRRVADAKAATRPKAERRRAEWAEARVAAMVAKGMTEAEARAALCTAATEQRAGGDAVASYVLPHLFELEFTELGVVPVADVLADPERYIEKTLADPHEGVEYGRGTAILYKEPCGLWIKSFAHGETHYYFERERHADDVFDDMSAQAPEGTRPEPKTAWHQGVEKRLTTVVSLNGRFALLAPSGGATMYISRLDLVPIADAELKRRLANEIVHVGYGKQKEPLYKPAFDVFTGNAHRHVYDCLAFSGRPVADNVCNLFRGLGVAPAPGKCDRMLAHVHEVICSGDEATTNDMLNLMAWQIQNIGEPSRVVVVLKSERHQVGKGVMLDALAKLYGQSGFTPAAMEQVVGRFNDGLRGKSFIWLDEVLFSGDRRTADAIKRMATASEIGIEGKGLPVVQTPVAVNIWISSNHDNAAHVEEADARYWVHDVAEHRASDAAYFAALVAEIKTGGVEAFAHHLLTRDVSNFVPSRDIKRDNAAKRAMIRESINPFDARKWLEECAEAELILGYSRGRGLPDKAWVAGDEVPFSVLSASYVAWQDTVRTRVAPKPTPANRLGEVLLRCGLNERRTDKVRLRILPAPGCLLSSLRGVP